ncbi:hypothetical protein ACJMK2_029694, partial [Sinanodonta woodiana]
KPESDWFYIKRVDSGNIYATTLVDYEQLGGKHTVHLGIQASLRLKFGVSGNPYLTSPPIHAYDGDRGINDTIRYNIENEMNTTFRINNISGEIYVLRELDADGGLDLYVIILKATEQSNTARTAMSTLYVRVIDLNDNPPICSPNHYNCNVTEHSAVGQVICSVTATDKDKDQNGKFSYELTNGNAVDIDPIYGYIRVKDSQMLDRETGSRLFLKVTAKSSDGNMTDKANVTINLIDINDNSPIFNQSSYNFIVQNISIGGYVGKISAFDLDSGDNQKLNYSWGKCLSNSGTCSGDNRNCFFPFTIDPESGTITLNGCTAECLFSTLVSVLCSTTLLVIQVEDISAFPIINRMSSVQESAANNSRDAQIPISITEEFDLINGHCIKRKSVQKEPEAVSTVLIVSTVLGSIVAVIVVGVIVYYWFILRR